MNHFRHQLLGWLPQLTLVAALAAQGTRSVGASHRDGLLRAPAARPSQVLFDEPGDGRLWAAGCTYKASFGPDGFVYVPFLGSDAPRNYPVRLTLRSVHVGSRAIDLAVAAKPTRENQRVTLDHGPVRESYDLTPTSVEQTFVVAGDRPGDVDVELEITTDLAAHADHAGLHFDHELGGVEYGTAYLVQETSKSEIGSTISGNTLRLHVPAALRRNGPIVIDPIITTKTLAPTLMASEVPDIAYDATTDRWLVTWAHLFSATDHDVLAELRSANGDPVPGSMKFIDTTTAWMSYPRVANLNSADRFLVVMEKVPQQAGQVYSVWGRTLDAYSPFALNNLFEVTPLSSAHQLNPDVGGDPGAGTAWTVVWVFGQTIYARQIRADGTPENRLIPVATGGKQCITPQISLSNGNGLTAQPSWCIVFNQEVSATDWDVLAVTMAPDGVLRRQPLRLAGGSENDGYPCVSSPVTDLGGSPLFMVTYERQLSSGAEMIAQVVDGNVNVYVPEVNLTRRYGYAGIFSRSESDGLRFATVSRTGPQSLGVGTLALFGNDLVEHETMQVIGTGGWPFLASKRSGGGGNTDYAIAYTSTSYNPYRIGVALYEGRSPLGGFSRRNTGCGLSITASGRCALGDSFVLQLGNVFSDVAGIALGRPTATQQICTACGFGIDLNGPVVPLPALASLRIPGSLEFVGVTLAVQGYAVGSGTCLSALRLSDTLDFMIQ